MLTEASPELRLMPSAATLPPAPSVMRALSLIGMIGTLSIPLSMLLVQPASIAAASSPVSQIKCLIVASSRRFPHAPIQSSLC
jgi:hypothetical protein